MTTALLVLAGLLILLILGMLFRLQVLLDVLRGTSKKRAGASNNVNAVMFAVFLVVGMGLIIWYSGVASENFLPEASSEHGKRVDSLFWISMAVIGFVFVVTHILLFLFPYIYQFKEDKTALFFPENNKLELLWTVIPAIVLTGLVFSGWIVWSDITAEVPEDHTTVEIMGKQFNWMTRYPGADDQLGSYDFRKIDATNQMGIDFSDKASLDDFIPREIHVPIGKPVLLNIRARDVLHSVFIPHMRVKMDAMPGMPTHFWFTPVKTTQEMRDELSNPEFNYEIACTEVCGRNHFAMRMLLVVDEPEDYEAWVAEQKPFLKQNPDYISEVPDELKPLALSVQEEKSKQIVN